MSYQITLPNNGRLTMNDVDFKCPKCGHQHIESDYEKKLDKSDYDYIYINCKNKQCGVKIGVTTDMRGDVIYWLKSEEKELLDEVNII